MKRINLDFTVSAILRDEDIKPSQKRIFRDSCISNGIIDVWDLCKTTEKKLLSLRMFDEELVKITKDVLNGYGLSLGMSEEELLDYEDAEYNQCHTEIKPVAEDIQINEELNSERHDDSDFSHIIQRMKEEYNPVATPLDNERKRPIPLLDDSLRQKLQAAYEHKVRSEVKERLTNRSYMKMNAEDMEWVWLHYFRTFYQSQPLFIRLMKSKQTRIEMAKKEADEMCEAYVNSLISTIANGLGNKFCSSLDQDWDEHWETIMKDLGIE